MADIVLGTHGYIEFERLDSDTIEYIPTVELSQFNSVPSLRYFNDLQIINIDEWMMML